MAESVRYKDGARVDAICNEDSACYIKVLLHRRTYVITERMLPPEIGIAPSGLLLTYSAEDKDYPLYSIQFETGCKEYATRPPPHMCIASVIMDGGRVKSSSVTKRVQIDEVVRRYSSP